MTLTHAQLWKAVDALAGRLETSPSGLARRAGLDPTSFNPSKRLSRDDPPRPRWPSTESLAKVLEVAGLSFSQFAALADGVAPPGRRGVPVIGMAQAGADGYFDDAGYPAGEGWDRIELPDAADGAFCVEIAGDSMDPLYREGDRVIVDPAATNLRRGDRAVARTRGGEVMAKEIARISAGSVALRSINPAYPERSFKRAELDWIARIVWASQ